MRPNRLVLSLIVLLGVCFAFAQSKPKTHYLVIFASISAKNYKSGYAKAEKMMSRYQAQGLKAQIYQTDEYSNLRDGYFAVAVPYKTKAEAKKNLAYAKRKVRDAYVKWAGHYEVCGC
ncbi:MAG: hypothetical protein WAO58_09765 [Fimbriimonadaceae bacterium]